MMTPDHRRKEGPAPLLPPSPWVRRFARLVPAGAVLDVAAGRGRHARLFLAKGHPVVAVDRDVEQLGELATAPGLSVVKADLEGGAWPFRGRTFAGVVVANYLHRPLLPDLLAAVSPGGALVYETFALGNERFGRPSNPAFLLKPGELLDLVRGRMRVVAFEDLVLGPPRRRAVQRIAALAPG